MKIVFNSKGDKNLSSIRIFTYNLFQWFSELGYDVALNDWDNYSKYDVAIFGRSTSLKLVKDAKTQNPNIFCGLAQPSDYPKKRKKVFSEFDFFITGSILEQDRYLEYHRNILLFPQIERIFTKIKVHENHSPIVIGYHGNLNHLINFPPSLKSALEALAAKTPIKLMVVYDKYSLGPWGRGRPDIEIEEVQWDINTIQEKLLQCDIGIVPGLIPINEKAKAFLFNISKLFNNKAYHNDYLLRFKNNTNSGRAFVFHQLGIPVISDFMPTSFHILDNFKCGYLAHSKGGWLSALEKLSKSAELRQEIAQNALKEFNRLYNPLDWSKRLHQDIEKLWLEKNNNG